MTKIYLKNQWRKSLYYFSMGMAVLTCFMLLSSENSLAKDNKISFDIPSQMINSALEEFARQSELSLVYKLEDLGSVNTNSIFGRYVPSEALKIILKDTSLIIEQTSEEIISIKKADLESEAKEVPKSVLSTNTPTGIAQKSQSVVPASKTDDITFDEMIVTASKRPRKLQKVPISIYALTGQSMEKSGIDSIEDISNVVGGMEIVGNGTGTVSIGARGVTNMTGNLESTAAVGYYIDEVPISSLAQKMPEVAMWDMERVEVLRGPQGTMFGEGSMAGTIRIITKKPDTMEYSSKVAGKISSVKMGGMNLSTKGMLNVPIVEDKLAFRVVASYLDRDGWIDVPDLQMEDANDFTQLSTRISALWKPNERLTLEGSLFNQEQDIKHGQYETSRGVFAPGDLLPIAFPVDKLSPTETEYDIYNLTMTYDFGFASLVSATSHFKNENHSYNDISPLLLMLTYGLTISGGFTAMEDQMDVELSTQELRLVSNGDERLDWTIGGFYKTSSRESSSAISVAVNDLDMTPFGYPDLTMDMEEKYQDQNKSDSTAYAVFMDVDYELNNKFALGAGARYYADDREYTYTLLSASPTFVGGDPSTIDIPTIVSGEDKAFTPRININWTPNDKVLAFAKVAAGFRSGGTNLATILAPQSNVPSDFSAEKLLSYELGVKTNIWQGVTINAYLYYNDWTDMQLSFTTTGPVQAAYRKNAGSARALGGELELITVLPIPGWTANLSMAYTDAEIAEDVVDDSDGSVKASKGSRIPYAPEWKVNISTEYAKALSDELFAVLRAGYTYRSETYSEPSNAEYEKNEPSNQVRASIGVESETWGVHLFAENIFDSDDSTSKYSPVDYMPGFTYSTNVSPQTIGLSLNVKF